MGAITGAVSRALTASNMGNEDTATLAESRC